MLRFRHYAIDIAQYRWLKPKGWTPLLHSVSLDVHPGEMVALIGASGAGKSLLLQSVLGLLPENMRCRGEIWLDGQYLQNQYSKSQFSYVPQSVSALNPLVTVSDQLARGAKLCGLSLTPQIIPLQLQSLGLSSQVAGYYPRQLSGGMAKRVLACGAMLSTGGYILADEITAWLDESHSCQLLNQLKELCHAGRGVLWVTHDLALAARYADKIALIEHGVLSETLPSHALGCTHMAPGLQAMWAALPEQEFMQTDERVA